MYQQPQDILIVCGSLKPGADGIGDYSRRLSGELIRKGHSVKILAYNDRYIQECTHEYQNADGTEIEVLRLPKTIHYRAKAQEIAKWLNGRKPEWVSIQYVLYAFNDKGLPFGFAAQIYELFKGAKFQMMFHELWLGMEKQPVFKEKLYGYVQSYLIKNMLKKLQPIVIHSHSRTYINLFKYHGVNAEFLPIISNIPIINESKHYPLFRDNGTLQFLIFGYISPGAPVSLFAQELKAYSDSVKRAVKVVFAGRNGASLLEWTDVFDQLGIVYEQRGILSVEALSDLMNESDIGISTTPFSLYEKSGGVAAMFNHALPVINVAVSVEWEPAYASDFPIEDPIVEYVPGMLKDYLMHIRKPELRKNLSEVADKFLEDIENRVVIS